MAAIAQSAPEAKSRVGLPGRQGSQGQEGLTLNHKNMSEHP
jgi:hypothetical protein